MYGNNRYDNRRRRRRPAHPSPFSTAASVATAAALAYGAYRIGSYIWNSYNQDEDGDFSFSDEEHDYDVLYEWNDNKFRGRNFDTSDGPRSYRSRRSRGDWSELNHRRRSHRPSPGEGYQHHNGKASVASISEDEDRVNISPIVRNARIARCRTEISRAMMDFLPTLKKAIARQTDVSVETEELKRLRVTRRERGESETVGDEERSRERDLWNEIKNKSVTRLFTTVYAHTIVFLVLTVQVNLLGGRLLREETRDTDEAAGEETEGFETYRSSHQLVLAKTYEHIFAKGIPLLGEAVSVVVERAVQDWDVLGSVDNGLSKKKDCVSLNDILHWVEQIRDEIDRKTKNGMTGASTLARFIIPAEDNNQDGMVNEEVTDELAKFILDETYDLLESPTFASSERSCLNTTFKHLCNDGYAKLLAPQHENGNEAQTVPLAAAITHLQKTAVSTFYKPPSKKDEIESWGGVFGMMEEPLPSDANVYIPLLERLDAVLELGNVCFD